MWLLILSVLVALAVSALCSLMEATLLSLRPGQIAEIAARRPRIGEVWQQLSSNVERPIASILILNTAAHTIGASVAGAEFQQLYGERWLWGFSIVFTFLMLQFTEILPKEVGVRYNRQAAFWIARPLAWMVRMMRPIQAVVHFINRPFGGVSPRPHAFTAIEEIDALSGFARLSGEISGELESILKRGAHLSGSKVREVMRPRVDIDAVDVHTPPGEVLGAVAMSGYSRVPVYEGDLDGILGFIYIKDVLLELHMGRPLELRRLIRPAVLVPETLRLDQLVQVFRQKKTQMAVVLDEHGGTEGLVTLEDVLEELVGTIHDERRREDAEIVREGNAAWLVSGTSNVDHVLEAIGRPGLQSKAPSQVSTIAGLVQVQLDRIAAPGDRTTFHDLSLEVIEMDGMRIAKVRVAIEEGGPGVEE